MAEKKKGWIKKAAEKSEAAKPAHRFARLHDRKETASAENVTAGGPRHRKDILYSKHKD